MQRSLEIREEIQLNEGRMLVIESLEGLSEIYEKTGKLDVALDLDRQALKLKLDSNTEWENRLEQKRHVARSHYNIGTIYYKKRDYMRAYENIIESYKIRDMLYLNENHPELFVTLNALANIYEKLNDWQKADHYGKMADHMRLDLEVGNPVRKVDLKNFDLDERYSSKRDEIKRQEVFFTTSPVPPASIPKFVRSRTFTDQLPLDDR